MSLFDLNLEDVRRVTSVLSDMKDGKAGTIKLKEVWASIRSELSDSPVTTTPGGDEEPLPGFSNPPPPAGLQGAETAVREGLAAVRAAMVERYGEEYTADLWKRVRK